MLSRLRVHTLFGNVPLENYPHTVIVYTNSPTETVKFRHCGPFTRIIIL